MTKFERLLEEALNSVLWEGLSTRYKWYKISFTIKRPFANESELRQYLQNLLHHKAQTYQIERARKSESASNISIVIGTDPQQPAPTNAIFGNDANLLAAFTASPIDNPKTYQPKSDIVLV